MDKKALGEDIWESIVKACNQGGRTRVTLPYDDVLTVLRSVEANVVSQIEDPRERRRVMQEWGPRMENMVNRVRARPNLHVPSRNAVVM